MAQYWSVISRTVAARGEYLPELVAGNPMDVPRLVRYLPSRPGYFTGVGIETYGPMISVRTRPGFDLLRLQ